MSELPGEKETKTIINEFGKIGKIGKNPLWNTLRDVWKIIANLVTQIFESDFDVGVKVSAFLVLCLVLLWVLSPAYWLIKNGVAIIAFFRWCLGKIVGLFVVTKKVKNK